MNKTYGEMTTAQLRAWVLLWTIGYIWIGWVVFDVGQTLLLGRPDSSVVLGAAILAGVLLFTWLYAFPSVLALRSEFRRRKEPLLPDEV